VKRGEDTSSLAEVATLKEGAKVQIGDRVVRRTGREVDEGDHAPISRSPRRAASGTDVNALSGTSVYLDGEWAGATGTTARRRSPAARPQLHAHAVPPRLPAAHDKIKVGKSGEAREFMLTANNALFRIDSEPTGASVTIDDEQSARPRSPAASWSRSAFTACA